MLQTSLFDIEEEVPLPERPELPTEYECPIPGYWPTGAGDPQKAWDEIRALKRKDISALRLMRAKWWCHFCEHWHEYDAFFFQMYDGLYPWEYSEVSLIRDRQFGGWEARLRQDYGLVGKSAVDVFRQLTRSFVYSYWANGGDVGRDDCGDVGEDLGEGEGTPQGDPGSSGEPRDSTSSTARAD